MSKFDRSLNLALRDLLTVADRTCQQLLRQEKEQPGSILEERPCPICGETRSIGHLHNGHFTYVRCANCSLLYMSPGLRDAVVEAGFSDEDPWTLGYWALMEGRIRLNDYPVPPDPASHPVLRDLIPVKPGGRLLDVGCSIGNFLAAARHTYQVEGLEINERTAKIARERGFVVHSRLIEQLELSEAYDVITFNQLLYGLKHPLLLIQQAARLLKPGGILYINTPHSDSLAMRLFGGQHCHLLGKVNLNVFNRRSLHEAATLSGLSLRQFYTEWLNLYSLDLAVYTLDRRRFVHRRNSFVPFYERVCSAEEGLQSRLLGHRFRQAGDYCVALLERPS